MPKQEQKGQSTGPQNNQMHAQRKLCPIAYCSEGAGRSLLQLCNRHCRAIACTVAAHRSSVLELRPASTKWQVTSRV